MVDILRICKILQDITGARFFSNLQNLAQYCRILRKLCENFEKQNLITCKILRNIAKSCARYEEKNLKTCKILRNIAESCASYVKALKTKSCYLQNLANLYDKYEEISNLARLFLLAQD